MADVAELLRPPRRVSVSQSARENVRVAMPGGHYAPWSETTTPYMVEPMDALTERSLEAVVFVGPARTGKTQALLDCWLGHAVVNDPGDFMVVHMSQDMARDYSLSRVDRLHEHSPAIGRLLDKSTHSDNVHDKFYRHGMILRIAWPTTKQLAARDIRYVALTDLDGMPQEIGPEKSTPFGLAQKRTETYMSSGMTLAESSPRFDWPDPYWEPSTPHELPPAKGICSLFNLGDRRVLYFQCPACRTWFVPDFPDAFSFDADASDIERAAAEVMYVCKGCGSLHPPTMKRDFLDGARWVPDGCALTEAGELIGERRRSTIASFRLPAGAAAFQPPSRLVRIWLRALRDFDVTGDETFKDHGRPYKPRRSYTRRSAKQLMRRAESDGFQRGTVPRGTRFLTAQFDVQPYRFAVMVIGWGVGLERWVIDRFDVQRSNREVDGARDVIDTSANDEDWDVLFDRVVLHSYPLNDGSGRRMLVRLTAGDEGGKAGVTQRAKAWWRRARDRGIEHRVLLVKGEGRKGTPRLRITHPDNTKRGDRDGGSHGDVPVAILNTNTLKDGVANDLDREMPGAGYVHFADGLPESMYDEITAEYRRTDGTWHRDGKRANESLDLLVYGRAAVIHLGDERMDWDQPKSWARDWDETPSNNMIVDGSATPPLPRRRPRLRRGTMLHKGM